MSPRIKICKETECNDEATTKGFCRFHYLKNWNLTKKSKTKAVQELNRYVERLVEKHPGDYMNEISKDISKWRDGGQEKSADDYNLFDDLASEDNFDSILENIKIDEEY